MSESNMYKRHTRLQTILEDGFYMGFQPSQTVSEAMHAGYAMCVVVPALNTTWQRLEQEMDAYFTKLKSEVSV